MRCSPRFRFVRYGGRAAVAAVLVALTPACDEPSRPPAGTEESYGRYDAASGTLAGRIESPGDDIAPLDLVATQITFDAANERLHVWVALRNPGTERTPAPDGVLLQCFVPRAVYPANAVPVLCMEQPPTECCGGSLFMHRGTFGGDFWLDAGEVSTPVEWIFHDPGGGTFSFAAHPEVPSGAWLSGTIYEDRNSDGRRQTDEPGIDRARVDVRGPGTGEAGASADGLGHWAIQVYRTGVYTLRFSVLRDDIEDCEPTTPDTREVLVVRRDDGSLADVDSLDYGCRPIPWPPSFTVRGFVYFDRDGDGSRDPGEPAFLNVDVNASRSCAVACAGHPQAVVAGAERGYEFALPAACCPAWRIDCGPVDGYEPTTPHAVWVESPAAGTRIRIDFGMNRPEPFEEYVVRGVVYRDLDASGTRDSSEPGIAGVPVLLNAILCDVAALRSSTDESGTFEIHARELGCPLPWFVALDLPDTGLRATSPDAVRIDAAPPGGTSTYEVDFGVAPLDE